MADLPDVDLTEKIGKFPVWVYGAGIGVIGLVGYFIYSRQSAKATPAATSSNIAAEGYSTSGLGGSVTTSTGTVATPETNQGWLTRAARTIAGTSGASPTAVTNALYKYVTGQDYTVTDKGYIDQALNTIGAPPDGTQGLGKLVGTLTGYQKDYNQAQIYAVYDDGTREYQSAENYTRAGNPQFSTTDGQGNVIGGAGVQYQKVATNDKVYAVDQAGKKTLLNWEQFVALGNPNVQTVKELA